MTWRTIIVRDRAKLDYSLNFLTVRKEAETRKVSLSEIYMIIIESTAVSITAVLLNELMKNKIKVIFCDEKRNPSSELIPYYGSHDTSLKYKKQLDWTIESKERIWTRVVYEKINNQMLLLKKLEKEEYKLLEQYLTELEWNDSSNREFMEPFRILVDETVFSLDADEFTKDHKNLLVNILNNTVEIDDKEQTVANAIKIYVRSLFTALKENDLEYIKMYKYEL